MTLNELVLSFEKNIEHFEKTDTKVSNSTVGWQIDHSLQVINNVCKALINSDPKKYKGKFSFTRSFLLAINYFPRGKVKAPKEVQTAEESIQKEGLVKAIAEANNLLIQIEKLPPNSYFKHPLFGLLNLKITKQFLRTHSYHHYKIVRDIIKK